MTTNEATIRVIASEIYEYATRFNEGKEDYFSKNRIAAIISKHLASVPEPLTPLQQAVKESDDDMARLDRNHLPAQSLHVCVNCHHDVQYGDGRCAWRHGMGYCICQCEFPASVGAEKL